MAEAGVTAHFVQDNHSFSKVRGVLRGLHFSRLPPRRKNWCVCREVRCSTSRSIFGRVPRPSVNGGGRLVRRGMESLFIPEGFAHGFVTLEDDTEVVYKVSSTYAPEFDRTVRYDDPALGIDWPVDLSKSPCPKRTAWRHFSPRSTRASKWRRSVEFLSRGRGLHRQRRSPPSGWEGLSCRQSRQADLFRKPAVPSRRRRCFKLPIRPGRYRRPGAARRVARARTARRDRPPGRGNACRSVDRRAAHSSRPMSSGLSGCSTRLSLTGAFCPTSAERLSAFIMFRPTKCSASLSWTWHVHGGQRPTRRPRLIRLRRRPPTISSAPGTRPTACPWCFPTARTITDHIIFRKSSFPW